MVEDYFRDHGDADRGAKGEHMVAMAQVVSEGNPPGQTIEAAIDAGQVLFFQMPYDLDVTAVTMLNGGTHTTGGGFFFRAESIAPVQNKVGAFLANPVLRNILTRRERGLEPRQLMDEGKILVVNLAKGQIGEDTAALLGSLLVSRLGLAALSRADAPGQSRRHFYLYLDEFQNFTTLSLANMLSELRKYRVGLVLAHQYLAQLDERVRDAILGNVGTVIAFRVGPEDAQILAREFAPEFSARDLAGLPNYHIYVKLMIDGAVSEPFSAETLSEPHRGLQPPFQTPTATGM
jgi:hypothetical protein